jgi:GGDEF domain-containing protein
MRSPSGLTSSRAQPPTAAARFSLALLSCVGLRRLAAGPRRHTVSADRVEQSRPADAQDSIGTPERWAAHRAAVYELGDTMISEAAARGQLVTVVMFEQGDLPELHALFGSSAARALASAFGARLRQLVGSSGAAVRSEGSTWTVVLPGHGAERALAAVRRVLGPGLATEVEVDGEEIVLVPRMAMHTVGAQAWPMLHIYREMRGKIDRAHALELRRQEYLRRERESHSRPAPLVRATTPAPATPRRARALSPAPAAAASPAA